MKTLKKSQVDTLNGTALTEQAYTLCEVEEKIDETGATVRIPRPEEVITKSVIMERIAALQSQIEELNGYMRKAERLDSK
jgi:hypothetical protein